MAWYPGAERMELQPESDAQAAIVPTQLIAHSIAAPWTPQRIFEYWRDSTNLESHFGLGFDGAMAQYIGTQTKADANMYANRRPDGTGAVSIETASNLQHTDPWTDAQVEELIRLGVWMHQQHGIPLRICRTHDDPGYGVHRMFPQWSDGGTACPGDARVRQFNEVVFPAIVARANGAPSPAPTPAPTPQEDDMDPSQIAGAPLPVYGPDGKLAAGHSATVGEYFGGLDLGQRRTDANFAAVLAQLKAVTETLRLVLAGTPGVDGAAILAAIHAIGTDAAAAVEQALAAGVDVRVAVGNTTTKES